jgi:hypothetical protein
MAEVDGSSGDSHKAFVDLMKMMDEMGYEY